MGTQSEFFARIIGLQSQNIVEVLGTDTVPIDPPIPVYSTQGFAFRVDVNMLTDKQRASLTTLLSREHSLPVQEVENSLGTLGFGIPMEDCVLPRVTQHQIDLLRNSFKENTTEACNGTLRKDAVFEVLQVSIVIIIFLLGDEWYTKNMKDTLFTNDRRIAFLRPGLKTDQQRYEHHSRTVLLAESLFVLQDSEGFDLKAEELQKVSPTNPDVRLEDIAIELQIASMIVRQGHTVKLRRPTGIKRQDFDLEIRFREATKIFGEIKCKRDDTAVNVNSLRRTLYTAEKQLPIDNPSVVFIRIPPDWIQYENLAPELSRTFSNFFRNVSHVNAIVLVWEELSRLQGGRMQSAVRFRFELHPSPQDPIEELNELLLPSQIPSTSKGSFVELAFGKFIDDSP